MKRARFAVGAAWGLLVATASVGCASHEAAVSRAALAATGSTYTTLEGVWEGEVWEIPSDYIQGVRRIAVKVSSDGSWPASTGGAICATGTAAVRDGLVILDGHRVGPVLCMPHSLKVGDGHMWAAFETSFRGGRTAAAMIGLKRVGGVAEAAEAADKR